MDIQIIPHRLSGAVTPPPSKSMAHRVLLAWLLSGEVGTLPDLGDSQDLQATRRCAAALRAPVSDGALPAFDCGESGSTLRFLIPLALALRGGGVFTGQGRLMERPQTPYFDLFSQRGIFCGQREGRLTLRGTLQAGVYRLPGNVSSQFVTGLLYALPLLKGDSEIQLTTPLESRGYVDLTLDVLRRFGVSAEEREDGSFFIPGGQVYRAGGLEVEADWSQAAFWYAAQALGSALEIQGLNSASAQGDRVIEEYFRQLCRPGAVRIDVSACPDLVPPLAVMAAARQGSACLRNAARLRLKESDRLKTTAALVSALGAHAEEGSDFLTIHGVPRLSGGTVDGANDHRIVMAAAIAATAADAPVTIRGAEAVRKSYPHFFEEYTRLGGEVHVL